MRKTLSVGSEPRARWWSQAWAIGLFVIVSSGTWLELAWSTQAQEPAPSPLNLPRAATRPEREQAPDPNKPAPRARETPAPGLPAATSTAPAGGSGSETQVAGLSRRYRFSERYATEAEKAPPNAGIGQYRVASRDVIRVATEKSQGSPARSERSIQVIYTEKPAAMNSLGQVTATVRRYEALRVSPPLEERPSAGKPLEGLSVWLTVKPGSTPELICLEENRRISEAEYGITLRQVFLPDLASVLPSLPTRVGDRWRLPRAAIQALLGERSAQSRDPLVGTLEDVRKGAQGDFHAIIGISGRATLPMSGDTALNAQLVFSFPPPAARPADAPAAEPSAPASGLFKDKDDAAGADVVDARGGITELRLARASTTPIPGSNGRLRSTLTWEQTLQRVIGGGDPLAVPATPPAASEANSWITYDDPRGRFHFRHPQDFLPQKPPGVGDDDGVQLGDALAGSDEGRILTLRLQEKGKDPQAEKANRDPESHIRELNEEWTRSKQDVLRGATGWLPEADWAPYKMRVYRIEAALRPRGPEGRNVPRIYLDYYLILLAQNESLVVTAMTGQDPPLAFRKDVEGILHTFQIGPSKSIGGGGSRAGQPTAGSAPIAAPAPVVNPPNR